MNPFCRISTEEMVKCGMDVDGWMDGWMDGPLPLIFPGAQMLSKGRYCIGIKQVREVSESGRGGI